MRRLRLASISFAVIAAVSIILAGFSGGIVRADSDSKDGTATVSFISGNQLIQVPNFDFGTHVIQSGQLFTLNSDGGVIGAPDTWPNEKARILSVQYDSSSAGTDGDTGWSVMAKYTSPSTSTTSKDFPDGSALLFTSTGIAQREVTSGQVWNNVNYTPAGGPNQDTNWKLNYFDTGNLNTANLPTQVTNSGNLNGILPLGPTSSAGSSLGVFGRSTVLPDKVLEPTVNIGGDTTKPITDFTQFNYMYNFSKKESAQIFVPYANQTIGTNIGSITWTLQSGLPEQWKS